MLPVGAAADTLNALAELQDELGDVHDADVLTELAYQHRSAGEGAPAEGWAALAERVAVDRAASREKALSMLAELRPKRWKAVRAPFGALKGLR